MKDSLVTLRATIGRIYRNLLSAQKRAAEVIARVHPQQRRSATNLIHYLALRCEDLRELQDDLHNAKKRYVFRPLKIAERFLGGL